MKENGKWLILNTHMRQVVTPNPTLPSPKIQEGRLKVTKRTFRIRIQAQNVVKQCSMVALKQC